MKALASRFMNDESGATMVEYAILVALISVAAILVIQVLGNKINNTFENVQSKL
ncbi:MAG: Flp family type IVb pilin [Halothiobacillaceae bacterium]|nr:MAG: Flp family type IVb pilin [Halothiobacillaceae bacterium]